MIQYCRYCDHMCCGDANYCYIKETTFTDKTIKSPNKCKYFDLNPIDALGENPNEYRPRVDYDSEQTELRIETMSCQECKWKGPCPMLETGICAYEPKGGE